MAIEPITKPGKNGSDSSIEKPPVFVAIPTPPEAEQDSAPKRRGRPPGSRNNAETAPKRGRKPRSLEPQIGAALVMANLPLMMFAPGDALDEPEIAALAAALDAQAKNSPRFRKYLQTALDASSGGQLITVSGVIIARRMARHEFMLPKAADDQLGSLLGSMPKMPDQEPEPDAAAT